LRRFLPSPPNPACPAKRRAWPGAGAAAGCPGEGMAAVPDHRYTGGGAMTTAMAIPGNTADTFLIHIFGRGLEDDRYVVERFRTYVAQRIMLR